MKQNNPLISIIIPTYKRCDKLGRAIDSVLKQSYSHIEIIIVDDNGEGSEYRDKVKSVINQYCQDERLRYIPHLINKGGAESRNTGANNARGEFILFLDDDDEFIEDKIEKQYKYYIENNNNRKIGLIYSYMIGVNENQEILYTKKNKAEGIPLFENMLECIANTSTWFIPKKVFCEIGGFENTPSKQDTIMLLKLMANKYEIYCVDEVLVKYYEHNDNRISGLGNNKIIGENNARNYSRNLYYMLDNKKQVKDVESSYSHKLLVLHLVNNNKKEARYELFNIIKNTPLTKCCVKSVLKYMFSSLYINRLRCRNEK